MVYPCARDELGQCFAFLAQDMCVTPDEIDSGGEGESRPFGPGFTGISDKQIDIPCRAAPQFGAGGRFVGNNHAIDVRGAISIGRNLCLGVRGVCGHGDGSRIGFGAMIPLPWPAGVNGLPIA